MRDAFIFFTAALVSYSLIFYVLRLTRRWRLIDVPNERSSHTQPTPKGGGVAIVLVTLTGVGILAMFGVVSGSLVATYLIGGAVIAVVGFVDDVHTLKPTYRLVIQLGIAALIVHVTDFWTVIALPNVEEVFIGSLGAVIAVLWIVGLVNAYNFMDGTDGMAAGVGLVASLAWVLMPWPESIAHVAFVRLAGLLLAGACLGFLGHNWSPARIFMGDVGSTFLGFSLAIFPLLVADHPAAALIGILLVWPFLFDTILTFLRRLKNGENVLAAHRSHLYQRLVIRGYSHQFVGLLYSLYAGVGAVLAALWLARLPGADLAIVVVIPALCVAHLIFVSRQEAAPVRGNDQR